MTEKILNLSDSYKAAYWDAAANQIVVTAAYQGGMFGAFQQFISNFSTSIGYSAWGLAGGLTFYDDGTGVFFGVARPGLIVELNSEVDEGEANTVGDWNPITDSYLVQSGPLPVGSSTPVYFDSTRGVHYYEGQLWSEQHGMYLDSWDPLLHVKTENVHSDSWHLQ